MFDDMAKKIEDLHLLLFTDIRILDKRMVITAKTSTSSSYQLLREIIYISDSVDKQVYDFEYFDDKNMVVIARKGHEIRVGKTKDMIPDKDSSRTIIT